MNVCWLLKQIWAPTDGITGGYLQQPKGGGLNNTEWALAPRWARIKWGEGEEDKGASSLRELFNKNRMGGADWREMQIPLLAQTLRSQCFELAGSW